VRKLAGRRRMAAFYKTERNMWLLSTISAERTGVARGVSRVFAQLVHPQIFYVHIYMYYFLFVFSHELICAGLVSAFARTWGEPYVREKYLWRKYRSIACMWGKHSIYTSIWAIYDTRCKMRFGNDHKVWTWSCPEGKKTRIAMNDTTRVFDIP